jgi:integrase
MAGKPKIPNVWWRNGWAWGRITYRGQEFRDPLDTQDPKLAAKRVQVWLEKLKGQRWGERPSRTFDDAASAFLDEHLPRLKGGIEGKAAQRYLLSLKHLEPEFTGMALDDIGSAALGAFETKRHRQGVKSGTIRNDLWCLSSIFTLAQEKEWTDKVNPVAAYIKARAKRGMLPPADPHTRYLSHDEEAELFRRCKGRLDGADHLMLAAGIALTIDIGLRAEELFGAEWPMIDLDKNEWHVPKELAKSGRARTIPVLPRSQAILRALRRSNQIKAVLWWDDVRPNGDGDPIHIHRRYTGMLQQLQNIASGGRTFVIKRELSALAAKGRKVTAAERERIAGIAEAEAWAPAMDHLIWHDLRRTCGCRLLQDHKLSMKAVSEWLGHESIATTEKAYAFLKIEHLHAAVGTGPNGIEGPARRIEDKRRVG